MQCIKGSERCPGEWSSESGVLDDGDFQLSLWLLYELQYAGFDDAREDAEADVRLVAARHDLERHFASAIDTAVDGLVDQYPDIEGFAEALQKLIEGYDGASLSSYLRSHGTAGEIRETLAQRSVLQLKEADPYTWVIPRLRGAPKVALAELQFDEYGAGVPDRLHQKLYERTLVECDLDPSYGAYVDTATPQMLALANAPTYFGMYRRLRGAAVGHLAAFEATSSLPSREYATAMRKAGFSDAAALYFDEHVEADAVHEHLAIRDVCGALVSAEPRLARDVLAGAAACLVLDDRFASEMLTRWGTGG